MLYLTFDNVEVGRLQAAEIFKVAPKGKYVIIKGGKDDPNSDLVRSGYDQVIGGAVKAGDVKIIGESYTDYWDPDTAQTETSQQLAAANNDVQAVLAENDGMAGGAVAALANQGLAGKVAVAGQDADEAALNRVAVGTQTVSVWKDGRNLGKAAGQAALELCKDPDVTKVAATAPFTTPGGKPGRLGPDQAGRHHEGQPQPRAQRRMDRQGHALPGRPRRFGRGLWLTISTTVSHTTLVLRSTAAVE